MNAAYVCYDSYFRALLKGSKNLLEMSRSLHVLNFLAMLTFGHDTIIRKCNFGLLSGRH